MGYRSVYSLSKFEEAEYNYVKSRYLEAIKLLGTLQLMQAQLRKQLKSIEDKQSALAKEIRRQMISNRLGEKGLRSLNKTIHYYYRWCDRHCL